MELTKEQIEECRANPTQAMIRRAALCDLALRGLASSASAIETTRCTCTDTTQCEYCRVLDEKNTRMLSAGTVAVPREPTDAMVQAGYAAMRKNASAEQLIGMTCEAEIYRAMLAAAPAAPEAGSEQIAGTTASARPEERPPQWTAVGYVDREGVARWELGRGPADHPHGTLLYVVKRPDMNSGLPKEKP